MKKKKILPILENIRIEKVVAAGKCLTRYNDTVVFVEGNVAPGDLVNLQIINKKKNFWVGQPIHIHEYSEKRETPFCSHFGICGGCKWQHLKYNIQLTYKHQEVIDSLERIAKVDIQSIHPILGSEKTTYYRNKLEFTFSNSRWLTKEEIASGVTFESKVLGFHVPDRFDKIVNIDHCYLQGSFSNEIRLAVKQYALDNNLSFFDLRKQENFLRNLVIRSTSTNELMVIVIFFYEDMPAINGLMNFLKEQFPQITSLNYIINSKRNDSYGDLEVELFHGKPYITEQMEDLQFRISPKSFYQTNSEQAYELYKIARNYADLQGNEVVYDLYTGTGTIANFVARQAKKVIGVEYIDAAIEDAKVNSDINQINNTSFFAGDMKDILTPNFVEEHGKPDVIITDPPRAGMHEDVVKTILLANPEKIVYISCNPATQARDIALLSEQYKVVEVQPVDMFPHTHHVESVVKLIRR